MTCQNCIPPFSSVSHFASAHIRSIYSYSLHILQYSCPTNLARYTLLGRIDQPFYCTAYARDGAINALNPYV